MNEAEKAIENAIHFEAKKDGLQQKQSGDWMFRLTIAAADMDERITKAPMGTRFQCVIVEVNDDESPRDHVAEKRDEDRAKWREMGPAQQAALRCKEPIFWAFLSETQGGPDVRCEETAAMVVRDLCRVNSRSDLNKPSFVNERGVWRQIDDEYLAWKVMEHA